MLLLIWYFSMQTWLSRRSRPNRVLHCILWSLHSRLSIELGLHMQDGQNMHVLHLHCTPLHKSSMNITRRPLAPWPMSWPCVRADCFMFHVSSMLMLHAVLDPTGKMLYFKKNWPEHLQDDVLACAEWVVCLTKLFTSSHSLTNHVVRGSLSWIGPSSIHVATITGQEREG